MDPSSPETLLYLRALQGHSGGKHIDLTFARHNVLLPSDFAEHIHHVGSSHDLHHHPVWIMSGWENVKKEGHAVFFTAVNPMFVDQHKEVEYDLTKPRVAVYKNNWTIHQNAVYWCNSRVAQGRGLPFQRNHSLQLCTCGVHQDGGDQEVRRRIVVKCVSLLSYRTELYSSRICIMDARILPTVNREHPSTIFGNIDFRIQGLPHSTVQQQNDTRKEAVEKLIHQFETFPNREALKVDLEKDQAFNPFSEKS